MFGCSDHWLGKRFSHALTGFLSEEKRRRELRANDAVDACALEERYEGWRVSRAGALKIGGAAAAFALADTVLPDASSAAPTTGSTTSEWTSTTKPVKLGRVHAVPSNSETVIQGLFDPTKAAVTTVDSGDVVAYENTWT